MHDHTQDEIKDWFNQIYKTRGFDYLRPQLAYNIFIKHLNAKAPGELLDVACGLGLMLKAAQQANLNASGFDLSEEAIRICQGYVPQAKTQIANAEQLNYADQQFDYITCLGSLERMMQLERVLAELLRVGKADAKYCFMVRNSNTFIWRFFKRFLGMQNHQGHQDAKSLAQWTALFEQAGYHIETVKRDHWPLMRWKRWLSFGVIPVDYCKQPWSPLPLEYATEFVFILRKKTSNA